MLDKNDRRYLRGSDPTAIVGSIQGVVYQLGIQLQQTGPNMWVGRGTQASYGMAPKVAVTVTPFPEGFCVDVAVSPDFESNSIVILVVAWLFFFPVAVILAVLGYQDWERRAQWLQSAIWTPLAHLMMAPPAPAFAPYAAPPVAPTAPGVPPAPRGPGVGAP